MSSHLLVLPSGATLDLNNLPKQPTLEMLQACRDHIFALEARHGESPLTKPRKRVSAGLPPSSSKAMKLAQVAKEKKSVVKEIQFQINRRPVQFYTGKDVRGTRRVTFSVDRLSPDTAEQLLLMSRDSWSPAMVRTELNANEAMRALSLSPGELTGAVFRSQTDDPFYPQKQCDRIGRSPLIVQWLSLRYAVKKQRLAGSLDCINKTRPIQTRRGRKRRRSNGLDENSSDNCSSDD